MLSERELSAAIGSTAYGPDGEKLGTVEHFFTDDRTGAPTWVAVSTGLLGTRRSVVPAAEATFADGSVRLPVTKEVVRSAPAVSDEHLDPDAEALLRRHYGLDAAGSTADTMTVDDATTREGSPAPGEPGHTGTAGPLETRDEPAARGDTVPVGGEQAGPTAAAATAPAPTDAPAAAAPTAPAAPADGAMTRSEEQLRVGTERVARTRVRLVKYVVTEEVTLTVPVRREEIRVEEVPLDSPDPGPGESLVDAGTATPGAAPGNPAQAGAAPEGELPEEIVLHAERPVVSVQVVPVERVRLSTEVAEGRERVTEQVQREQITVDEDRRP